MSMYRLALRSLLFRGRTLALALLPIGIGLVAVGVAVLADPGDLLDAYSTLTANLLVALVLAIVALVIGVNAFDDEREGGTLPLLLATAVPRWRITGAKLLGAWTATVTVCVPAVLGCGILGMRTDLDPVKMWAGLVLTVLAAGLGYGALFVLLSLVSRQSLLIGLGYVVVWEGVLAGQARALRNLSVGAYGRRVLSLPWTDPPSFAVADPQVAGALILLVALAVVAWLLASRRLRSVDALS